MNIPSPIVCIVSTLIISYVRKHTTRRINFSSSLTLKEKLKLSKIRGTGTIMPDRTCIPPSFAPKEKRRQGGLATKIVRDIHRLFTDLSIVLFGFMA